MNQFPSGHSPAQSPLSPGNYGGDDYFSSRQISPGPASSPSGSSKIKSRPRTSTSGVRVSQGGIKALFGQGSSKNNRTSLDLKSETSINIVQPQQGLTATMMAASQTSNSSNFALPTPRKKKSLKTLSADISIITTASSPGVEADAQPGSSQAIALNKNLTPGLTLAERRAAAAAALVEGIHRRRSASESSTLAQKPGSVPSTPTSLIPPNLGLDSRRFVLPPN
ncbi:hypothetical protein BGZ65_012451, partial [Modicella reniformis]